MLSDRWVRILTVVGVVGGLLLGGWTGPREANRAFFEASSQIIPVLLLALAVEAGALRARRAEGPVRSFLNLYPEMAMLLILILGEIVCLDALAGMGEEESKDSGAVFGTMYGALLGLGVQFLYGFSRTDGRAR
jgi:hypothetical protein